MHVTSRKRPRPRLAEDAAELIVEGVRFWEAGEVVLVAALMSGDHAELVDAAAHVIVCGARARRFIAAAVHVDREAVA
jgi:hypothetical protein